MASALWTVSAVAQEERPQITPGERKGPRKKDAGPRAVAVLRLGADGKASLVPIAILVGGKFWDASAYKADPVPMALDPGVVYEAERAGSSQGLFTVSAALRSNAANSPTPWVGTGAWAPAGSEKASPEAKSDPTPVGIDASDGPPRLTRTPNAASAPPAPASTKPASVPSGPRSDDEPPRLSKPASSSPPSSSAPSASPAPPDSKGSSSAPSGSGQGGSDSKPPGATKKTDDQPPGAASDSGAGEANRPRLRRGKPAESFADEVMPGYSKPGSTASKTTAKAGPPAQEGPVQLVPAISDAEGPVPHSYVFQWLKDEEGERTKQIQDLAKQQLRAYIQAQAKARIMPAAQSTPGAHRPSTTKRIPDPILENVKVSAYDLWNTNQPVLVLTADAHLPPPPPGTAGGVDTALAYSVTVVAYPDIYNGLRKIYSGITDKYHLDLTPRLELIDAVDADGDGRGELLFRATSDAGTGWRIYRATADTLWKMYDSLNPE